MDANTFFDYQPGSVEYFKLATKEQLRNIKEDFMEYY